MRQPHKRWDVEQIETMNRDPEVGAENTRSLVQANQIINYPGSIEEFMPVPYKGFKRSKSGLWMR